MRVTSLYLTSLCPQRYFRQLNISVVDIIIKHPGADHRRHARIMKQTAADFVSVGNRVLGLL